jgi:KaiC/GvpD/RAD55 family RecA-like ATPase
MAEGFATAATIHQATGRPCAIAYSASNLVPVLGALRAQHGATQEIVIVADLDKSGVGQKYAEQACAKHGGRFVVSPTESDVNDFVQTGGDLAFLLAPTLQEWLMGADSFSSQPAPLKWLIRDWVQANALIMIHGPSGGGKTFITLDWILRIASTITEWNNKAVKNGSVIYLAGEGHHGLKGRIAGWKHHHNVQKLDMWVSPEGVDLNTPEGYNKVAEAIRALGVRPSLIAVDTMHRHLLGDENSAQDAKTMLDACGRLIKEFECTVVLVHHTGVSEEAQHRARGSSAWKGALDIEISVVPSVDGRPIEIIQRKSKDSELAQTVYAKLIGVQIPNWFDEDGEPVTTAVVELVEPEISVKKDTKTDENIKRFKRSWFKNHCEIQENAPFVSRDGMIRFLIENDGLSKSSAETYCKPSNDKFIGSLVNADVIRVFNDGWVISNEVIASAFMLEKNG